MDGRGGGPGGACANSEHALHLFLAGWATLVGKAYVGAVEKEWVAWAANVQELPRDETKKTVA